MNAPRPCRFWLPWLISLAIHAVVIAALTIVPGPRNATSNRHLVIDAGVADDDDVHLTLFGSAAERVLPIKLVPAAVATEPPRPAVVPTVTPEPASGGAVQPVAHVAPSAAPAAGGNGPGGPASGAGQGRSTTSFFAIPTQGRKVVYVIDRSVSMGLGGALAAVKRELLASLSRLPPDACFQVVFYNRTAEPLLVDGTSGLLLATPANQAAVARKLDALEAEGGTEHLPALTLALAYEPDAIYFLTDADDLLDSQVQQATQRNAGRTSIHTLELTTANRDRKNMPLHVLARDNRGTYLAVGLP